MVANMCQVNDPVIVNKVKQLFNSTQLTIDSIAKETNISSSTAREIIKANFSPSTRKARSYFCYRNSKLGEKNPSFNKKGENSRKYKGIISDGRGYQMIIKPDWYTGRPGSKHVFLHTVIMCDALGITELPKGFVVHHIDGVKTNNTLDNLALVTIAGHSRIHSKERATTIPEGSREE